MSTALRIPNVGESIQEVQIGKWLKQEGDHVDEDENVVELETEKASLELPAPVTGILKIVKQKGQSASIGETIAYVEESQQTSAKDNGGAKSPTEKQPAKGQSAQSGETRPHATPAARRALHEHHLKAEDVKAGGKQLRREDVLQHVKEHPQPREDEKSGDGQTPTPKAPTAKLPASEDRNQPPPDASSSEQVVPMSMIRRRIAERLVEAQKNAALLTTYNEVDMSAVISLRQEFGERFREKFNTKLGFMSFFVKAVVEALKEIPELNAEIRDTNIVYRNRYDIGIAIGSEHGLVVPVVRNADRLSFAEIEVQIADFATRANAKKLAPQELTGGTFTISNGGIYGSLLSTPIVNPPQSGVLGMHAIQDRPIAREGQVVIRPMMYLALTYDHRIIDGREAVTWLRRVKETIEQPSRLLIEV